MKPAPIKIRVTVEFPFHDPLIYDLPSDTQVLLVPGDVTKHTYGRNPCVVREIVINKRGLRRFPEPPKQYALSFGGTKWPGTNVIESIVRPVRLANSPPGTRVLILLPRSPQDDSDEPELIWRLCEVQPGAVTKKSVEKIRKKAAYKTRRYQEQPTRFEREPV